MSRADELRAELELAELEDELVAAKGTKPDDLAALKAEVRDARREYREAREGTVK